MSSTHGRSEFQTNSTLMLALLTQRGTLLCTLFWEVTKAIVGQARCKEPIGATLSPIVQGSLPFLLYILRPSRNRIMEDFIIISLSSSLVALSLRAFFLRGSRSCRALLPPLALSSVSGNNYFRGERVERPGTIVFSR